MRIALCAILFLTVSPLRAAERVVIIDPGHGGRTDAGTMAQRSLSASNNATAPSGLKEKDLTLELSQEIRAQAKALAAAHPETKLECRLTRTDDRNPDFIKRAEFCAAASPAPEAIVSIHFNASGGKGLGTLTVVHNPGANVNYRADVAFATGLTKATSEVVSKFVPGSRPREPLADSYLHGGTGSSFFFQLAKHPELGRTRKCFLEVEFIDRADVDKSLLQNRATTFPVIARAIAEYLYTQVR